MALTFSEGSIGRDIETVNLRQLEAFYGRNLLALNRPEPDLEEPRGSNGIAIAPSNTLAHHALLLINPHTSFYFRSELQMASDEGLNAYGAVTWGQFFVYQGFNERAGWMHTTSNADAVDEYLETIEKKGNRYFYKFGSEERPVTSTEITVPYKTDRGMAEKKFTVYRTHHGPIVREMNGKWVIVRLMQEPVKALSSPTCAPRRETTRPSAKSWTSTPTPPTTRSSPTPTATSPTSTETSFLAATPVLTGPSR
jgi:acyl-homoserine lactone acylase PvdQ